MIFYTYLWLREDGTPYYVGKGSGYRAFSNKGRRLRCTLDRDLIVLQYWESEDEAFEAEKFLISYYGRIDTGTGCLRNLTDGGESPPRRWGNHYRLGIREAGRGKKKSAEHRRKIGVSKIGKKRSEFSVEWRKNIGLAHKGKSHDNGRRGMKHKPETIEKMRRIWNSPERLEEQREKARLLNFKRWGYVG